MSAQWEAARKAVMARAERVEPCESCDREAKRLVAEEVENRRVPTFTVTAPEGWFPGPGTITFTPNIPAGSAVVGEKPA